MQEFLHAYKKYVEQPVATFSSEVAFDGNSYSSSSLETKKQEVGVADNRLRPLNTVDKGSSIRSVSSRFRLRGADKKVPKRRMSGRGRTLPSVLAILDDDSNRPQHRPCMNTGKRKHKYENESRRNRQYSTKVTIRTNSTDSLTEEAEWQMQQLTVNEKCSDQAGQIAMEETVMDTETGDDRASYQSPGMEVNQCNDENSDSSGSSLLSNSDEENSNDSDLNVQGDEKLEHNQTEDPNDALSVNPEEAYEEDLSTVHLRSSKSRETKSSNVRHHEQMDREMVRRGRARQRLCT